jgi:hypothetical protein
MHAPADLSAEALAKAEAYYALREGGQGQKKLSYFIT